MSGLAAPSQNGGFWNAHAGAALNEKGGWRMFAARSKEVGYA